MSVSVKYTPGVIKIEPIALNPRQEFDQAQSYFRFSKRQENSVFYGVVSITTFGVGGSQSLWEMVIVSILPLSQEGSWKVTRILFIGFTLYECKKKPSASIVATKEHKIILPVSS